MTKKPNKEVFFDTHLIEACKAGDVKKIGMLIEKYNTVPYLVGYHALAEASRIGNLDVVKFLLSHGVQQPTQNDLATLIISVNFAHGYNENHTKIINYLKSLNTTRIDD